MITIPSKKDIPNLLERKDAVKAALRALVVERYGEGTPEFKMAVYRLSTRLSRGSSCNDILQIRVERASSAGKPVLLPEPTAGFSPQVFLSNIEASIERYKKLQAENDKEAAKQAETGKAITRIRAAHPWALGILDVHDDKFNIVVRGLSEDELNQLLDFLKAYPDRSKFRSPLQESFEAPRGDAG